MRVFLSSVIAGFEYERAEAAQALEMLGHDVIRAEDFGASPLSAQFTCLDGVRGSDLMVLVLGGRYGHVQDSGVSATHEEWREAVTNNLPVLAFIVGDEHEDAQSEFIREVTHWSAGSYVEFIAEPTDLRSGIARRMKEHEVREASALTLDEHSLTQSAINLFPETSQSPVISLAVSGWPDQPHLGAADMVGDALGRAMMSTALTGDHAVLATTVGITTDKNAGRITLSEHSPGLGVVDLFADRRIHIVQSAVTTRPGLSWSSLIEEDLVGLFTNAFLVASELMDHIDVPQRLSSVAVAAALTGAGYTPWLTESEAAHATSVSLPWGAAEQLIATVNPSVRPIRALNLEAVELATELVLRLRDERGE